MKKAILLATVVLVLFSCTKSDNDSKEYRTVILNPPEWIQGIWLDETREFDWGWEFSDSQVIYINNCENCVGYVLNDRAETILNTSGSESSYVSENNSDSYYRVYIHKIDRFGESTEEYSFYKRPDNQIEWKPTIPGIGLLTKQ